MLGGFPHNLIASSSGSIIKPQDVFATSLYTGPGSTQTITNGIDLAGKGGLVWFKHRTAGTQNHTLFDTARTISGYDMFLSTNTTDAESASGINYIDYLADGFTIRTASNFYNISDGSYVNWSFAQAPDFFAVVTWTGDGVAGRQIPLPPGWTKPPGMIVVKRRDSSGSGDWWTYHRTQGGKYLQLNTTAAANASSAEVIFGNGTATVEPTASHFTVGNFAGLNASGSTYVAYVFGHSTDPDGIIQAGSTFGGSPVNLGWRPQFVLMRWSNAASNWTMLDASRGMSSAPDATLHANDTSAEASSGNIIDVSASGFTAPSSWWGTTNTLIYLAIRAPIV